MSIFEIIADYQETVKMNSLDSCVSYIPCSRKGWPFSPFCLGEVVLYLIYIKLWLFEEKQFLSTAMKDTVFGA